MKLAVKIVSYVLGLLMGLGVLVLANEGGLDGNTFFAFVLIEAQVILTLVYVYDTEDQLKTKKK